MEINFRIDYKNFGRHSRDETRKITKDKGHALTRNWKYCLECASSKTK